MARINRELVFSSYIAGGSIEIYLETEIIAVDCIANTRDVRATIIAVNNTDTQWLFYSGDTSVSALGVSGAFTKAITLGLGETRLAFCQINGVSGDIYPESMPMTVTFGHTCVAAGFTKKLSETRDFTIGKLVTGIKLKRPKMDHFLGDKLYFEGVVLDDGYDAWVDVVMNNRLVETVKLDRGEWCMEHKLSWAELFPDKTYCVGKINVWASCNGQRLLGEMNVEAVFNIRKEDGMPIAELDITSSSENAAVQALGYPVRNKSTVTFNAQGCSARYGATITEMYMVFDGQKIESDMYTTDILTEKGVHSCSVTVVDSRGFKNTASGSFEVLDYAPPTASASVIRCDENGTPDTMGSFAITQITCNDLYRYDGANESYLSYTLRKKTGNGAESAEVSLIKTNAACIFDFGLEIDASYEFKLFCRDDFGGVSVYIFDLDCARVELNLAKDRVAVGKYAVRDKLFDCAWPARINGDITFTDESENEISLRSALLSGESAVRFKSISVDSETELEAALSQENDGLCITVVSLPQEKRAYLLYKIGDESGRLKLFCE